MNMTGQPYFLSPNYSINAQCGNYPTLATSPPYGWGHYNGGGVWDGVSRGPPVSVMLSCRNRRWWEDSILSITLMAGRPLRLHHGGRWVS